jgi:glycosyltransferase involved in cell wall biosynthesis
LKETIGGEIPIWQKSLYALLNCSLNYTIMKERTYMDVRYRNALSRSLAAQVRSIDFPPDSVSIQLGAMFNLNAVLGNQCFRTSYNDGNFFTWSKSPYFPRQCFSAQKIDAAIQFEKNVLDGTQMIFTMSEFLRQSFINDYGQPADKVFVIGTGINIRDSAIQETIAIDASTKRYDTEEVLFIGVDFFRKGGAHLLAAFKKVRSVFPRATLQIVGPTQPPAGLEHEEGVVWNGFLRKDVPADADKLKQIISRASLFVMPSVYEPFGIAPLEAMLHNIPCLVSNRWALPEIVREGITGELVEPGNEEMIAEKIIHLFHNPSLLQKYGSVCRSWVLDNFLWHKVVDRLETCLEQKRRSIIVTKY